MAALLVDNLSFQERGPFNLQVQSNECISLTGPSGAGKSLLLRAIADLDPHRGNCFIDNKSCSAMPAPQWRQLVGLMPAKSVWWFDTVGEHFQHYEKSWLTALGFESQVMNWTVSRLSSGEQQRLSIVRMLQNQPKVLLLDEPTASLDTENTKRVEKLIHDYQCEYQCAIIWVTHDREQAARIARRHFIIEQNQLQELGSISP